MASLLGAVSEALPTGRAGCGAEAARQAADPALNGTLGARGGMLVAESEQDSLTALASGADVANDVGARSVLRSVVGHSFVLLTGGRSAQNR